MGSRENLIKTLNHQEPDRMVVDLARLVSLINMFGHRQEEWKEFKTPWD
jgi:hypothetical protein